jgi:hypothetical protein
VAWALSSADDAWTRGFRTDALKWLQHAVEAATAARRTERAEEIARAASALRAEVIASIPPAAEPPPPAVFKAPSSGKMKRARSVPKIRVAPPASRADAGADDEPKTLSRAPRRSSRKTRAAHPAPKEPPNPVTARHADAFTRDPKAVMNELDREPDPARHAHKMELLARACEVLADRGAIDPLAAILAWLPRSAKAVAKSDPTRAHITLSTLAALRTERVLVPIARSVLELSREIRDVPAQVLIDAGSTGAQALCIARRALADANPKRAYPRFRLTMREIGPFTGGVLGEELDALGNAKRGADPAYAEDLLASVPPELDADLGAKALPFAVHADASVRTAALRALAATLGAAARPSFVRALADARDEVRVVAFAGLALTGGVDGEIVAVVTRVLGEASASVELRAAAAGTLRDTRAENRREAGDALRRVLDTPKPRLLKTLLRARSPGNPNAPVLLAAARSLVALEGAKAREAIEACAAAQDSALREKLLSLARGGA